MDTPPDGLPVEERPYGDRALMVNLRMVPFGTKLIVNCGRVYRKVRGVDQPWYSLDTKHGDNPNGGPCSCADSLPPRSVRWIPSLSVRELAAVEGPLNWGEWAAQNIGERTRMNEYEVKDWIGLRTADFHVTSGYDVYFAVLRWLEVDGWERSGSLLGTQIWTKR